MTSTNDLELVRSEAFYYHDQVTLLRVRLYRWGMAATPRLQHLERELRRAEQRLSQACDSPRCPATTNAGRKALGAQPLISGVNNRCGQES